MLSCVLKLQSVAARKQVLKFYIQGTHYSLRSRFQDGEALSVKNGRWRSFQVAIDHAVLRKVSDLGRTSEITDGRKQVVLNNRAKNNTRAKPLWLTLGSCGQFIQFELS